MNKFEDYHAAKNRITNKLMHLYEILLFLENHDFFKFIEVKHDLRSFWSCFSSKVHHHHYHHDLRKVRSINLEKLQNPLLKAYHYKLWNTWINVEKHYHLNRLNRLIKRSNSSSSEYNNEFIVESSFIIFKI